MIRLNTTARAATAALVTVFVVAAVSAAASARTSGNAGASAAGTSAGGIAIGYENNGADPSQISIANGYFRQELGSGVQLKLFSSGPAALSALASGSLPFMCGLGFPPVISAIAQGVPLQIVFNQERYTGDAGLVVKSGSGIDSIAQLKGKSIGIVIGSQSSFELATFAKNAGLDLSSVKQVNLSPPEIQSAWSTGDIDAAIVWDPVFDYLTSHGGHVLATDKSLPADASSYNICVANKNYAAAHPTVAAAFEKALGDGVTYLQQHRAQAIKIAAKAAGISVATAKSELAGYQLFSLKGQTSPTVLGTPASAGSSGTAQSLLSNWKALYAAGTVTKAPPSSVAADIDPSYAQQAAAG